MTGEIFLCIDIGSTRTKGAVFDLSGTAPLMAGRAETPTTREDLARGFARVLAELCGSPPGTPLDRIRPAFPVRVSSSAKGGLTIAAVGLVPDLTLQAARLTAWSAGARVIRSYAYALTPEDVREMESLRPDIVLLCGGTDGGNAGFALGNAARLAGSRLEAPILYAGNRAAAGEAAGILRGRPVDIVPNLMPEVGVLRPEPARARIREIFLRTIVNGKGLGEIAARFDTGARPTPLGVYELAGAISRSRPDWSEFCAVDLGGATTDVYSVAASPPDSGGVVLKGLPEPRRKRTVEGDLGIRLSAAALLESAGDDLKREAAAAGLAPGRLKAHVEYVSAHPGHLPADPEEAALDELLAQACVHDAVRRHAGTWRESATPSGRVFVQAGKDLRRVVRVVATGGYLSRLPDDRMLRRAFRIAARDGEIPLSPERPAFYADRTGSFPLLGNLAGERPEAAVALALDALYPLGGSPDPETGP